VGRLPSWTPLRALLRSRRTCRSSCCEQASGTSLPRSLLHLYIAYRAQVRAKVTALRVEQEEAAGGDAATL
jgi:aminoglycoside phosphotransferase family enzyme